MFTTVCMLQSVLYYGQPEVLSPLAPLKPTDTASYKRYCFYFYFFICYRHNCDNRRETAVRGRKKSQIQRHFMFVHFFSCLPLTSLSPSLSLFTRHALPFFTATFPFIPVFKRGRDPIKKRRVGNLL